VLSREELIASFKRFGGIITLAEANQIMKMADTDGSGYIDYTEFIAAASDRSHLVSQ
jgi:Ca2+-binding EF-hand superfamily protein